MCSPSPTRSAHAREPRAAHRHGRRLGGFRGCRRAPRRRGHPKRTRYVERYELQPIDPQTNGPQYFYGLRYHTHITKPGEVETFHDQVGYWLWNPVEGTVTQTIAIPRAPGRAGIGPGRGRRDDLHAATPSAARRRTASARTRSSSTRSRTLSFTRHGHGERRRHVGVRRGHRAAGARPRRAVPPHRPPHAPQGRRTHAEPTRPRRVTHWWTATPAP